MKFNLLKRSKAKVKNHEGADAYQLSPKMELYAAVVASSLNDSFYEKEDQRLKRIQNLITKIAVKEPEFVAKLAVYARKEMKLRSMPLVLTVELAKIHRGDDLIRRMSRYVIQRADEITEMLAYYQSANARSGQKKLNGLSKQLQKGIADAFNRFDEYQFAKYNRATEVTLRDALFLVHPKAKNELQQQIFDRIAGQNLQTAYTWETQLTTMGQQEYQNKAEKEQAKKASWEELIQSGKLGYMALLRNLRNLLEAEISDETLQKVIDQLIDPVAVRRSRQLPFRFLSAWKELKKLGKGQVPILLDALEEAMGYAVGNIPGITKETRVLIASDLSGSMDHRISGKSQMTYKEIGTTMAALLQAHCSNVITGGFGESYRRIQMGRRSILSNASKLSQLNVGHSTNGYLVIKDLIKRKDIRDKVMIFTDCQLWNTNYWNNKETIEKYWKEYRKIAPNAKLYLFDLAGLGNSPINATDKNVFLIAGWSEKVFQVLKALEEGGTALDVIEQIDI